MQDHAEAQAGRLLRILLLWRHAMPVNPGGKEAWQFSCKSLLLTIRRWLVRQAWQDCGYIYRCCDGEVRTFSWIVFSAISAQHHSQTINPINGAVAPMHIFPVDMKIRFDGDRIEDLQDCHTFNKYGPPPFLLADQLASESVRGRTQTQVVLKTSLFR
jgi:hypothetical protein